MKTRRILGVLALILLIGSFTGVLAEDTATQILTITVLGTTSISVNDSPGLMEVTAGGEEVSDDSTNYGIVTNEGGKKITGELQEGLPTGVTLKVELAADYATPLSEPEVLSTIPVDLVTGIEAGEYPGNGITYYLSAEADAQSVTGAEVTVVFTITDE